MKKHGPQVATASAPAVRKGPEHEYKHDAVQDCKDIRLVMEAVCQAVVASPGLRRLAPR